MKSMSNDISTQYEVHYGDWGIDDSDVPDENDPAYLTYECKPSTELDDRLIKSKVFFSRAEADKFAKKLLKKRKDDNDDKWLAYIEIKECVCKVIDKLK